MITSRKEIQGFEVFIDEFKDAHSYAEYLKDKPLSSSSISNNQDVRDEIEKGFNGVSTLEEAYSLLQNGYNYKGLPKFISHVNSIQRKIMGSKPSFRNNVVGFMPIVPLALQGVPNCMIESIKIPFKTKIVKILYDSEMICSVSADEVEEAAKKIIELTMRLEASGYRVELVQLNAFWPQTYAPHKNATIAAVTLKEANRILDLKRLMFPMLHRAWFRAIGFRYQDVNPNDKFKRGRGTSLTYAVKDDDRRKEIMKGLFGDNSFYFTRTDTEKLDVSEMIETMTSHNKKKEV